MNIRTIYCVDEDASFDLYGDGDPVCPNDAGHTVQVQGRFTVPSCIHITNGTKVVRLTLNGAGDGLVFTQVHP
jgi:hypothetical protein